MPALQLGGVPRAEWCLMNREDQRPAVPESVLPADGLDELAAFGVHIGTRVHQARQLRRIALPDGWFGTGHRYGMWEHIFDHHRRMRASVAHDFDGAEFRAFTVVLPVRAYVMRAYQDSTALVLDRQWATRTAVRDAIDERQDCYQKCIAFWSASIDIGGDYSTGDSTASEQLRMSRQKRQAYERLAEIVERTPELPA